MSKLHVLTAEPQGEGIIEILEELMVQAKAGEISSIGVAVVDRAGCCESRWNAPPSQILLIGAVQRLLHRLNLRADG